MKVDLKLLTLTLLQIELICACHSAEEEGRRKKRQAENVTPDNTRILREYFTNCMASRVQNIWDWQSVIDTTILDTIWYEDNAESECNSLLPNSENQDTPECWSRRLNVYLRNTSFLVAPSRDCINQYANDTRLGIADQSSAIFSVPLETADRPRERCIVPSPEPFMPNSPRVAMYTTCNGREFQMPENRRTLDFPSVFQFIADHTICSSELNGCDNNNREILPSEDPDVPRWPYRYEAIVKTTSPLRNSIDICNSMVYALPNDWGTWGDCSVSCGGGTQTRTRDCTEPDCATIESRSCSTTRCPGCAISTFSRQRCGEPSTTEDQCIQLGCCFEMGLCYRSREPATTRSAPLLTTQAPCAPSGGSFISFQSTPGTLRSFGGQPGFPGSSINLECNEANGIIPCLRGTSMACSMCARMACCWSERRQLCYRPVVAEPPVARITCAPGFENPPACTDINDCTPGSCLNGGTCIDRIQGVECQCPEGFSGSSCGISPTVCSEAPTVDNAMTSPPGPFNVDDEVTYTCNDQYILEGNAILTCQSTGQFAPAILPTCVRVCSDGPPTNPGVSFIPLDEYPNNVFVPYFCLNNGILSPSTATNQCVNGAWVSSSPSCFTCASPPSLTNGFYQPSGNLYNADDTVIYICFTGFTLIGLNENTCTSTGDWTQQNAPLCSSNFCSPLPDISNGNVGPEEVLTNPSIIGTTALYTCDSGFFSSTETLVSVCTRFSVGPRWSLGDGPVCSQGCLPPTNFPSPPGIIDPLSNLYRPDDEITFSCNSGFTFSGVTTSVCNAAHQFIFPGIANNVCFRNCPNRPEPPAHAQLVGVTNPPDDIGTYPTGSVATYQCNTGYVPSGQPSIICLNSGDWEVLTLTCSAACFNLPILPSNSPGAIELRPVDNTATTSPFLIGDAFSYVCVDDVNFQLTPASNSLTSCDVGGSFTHDASPPICQRISCFSLPVLRSNSPGDIALGPVSNTATSPPFLVGDIFSYVCVDAVNFQLFPASNALTFCEVGGSFTLDANPPTCQQTTCFSLPVLPSNSPGDIELRPVGNTATTSPFLLGDAFSYVCVDDVNFQLTPTSNLLTSCEVGGSFTHDASPPVCQQINCLAPPPIVVGVPEGIIGNPPYSPNEMITYSCASNYRLVGTSVSQCLGPPSFGWTLMGNTLPRCIEVCPDPPSRSDLGFVRIGTETIPDVYFEGDSISYFCTNNLLSIGPSTSECLSGGLWSLSTLPICRQVCPDPPTRTDLDFVRIGIETIPGVYLEGDMISYSCVNGLLSGASTSECESNGEWSLEILPQCLPFCLDPPTRTDLDFVRIGSETIPGVYLEGDMISYSCVNGLLSGASTSECESNGEWSLQILPQCQPFCDITMVPDIPSAVQQASGPPPYLAGASVQYTCTDPTEDVDGIDTVICQNDGSWQSTPGTCVQTRCGPPTRGTIDNGMISISETSYVVGAQLIYLCVAGFDTRVSTITECEPDFTWTLDDNPPSCTRACPEIPSIVSGQQITTGGDMPPYFSGDTISYRCRDGFSSRIVFSDVICVCGGTTSLSWSCTTLDLSQICRRDVNIILTMSSSTLNEACATTQPSNRPIGFSSSQISFVDFFDTAWGTNAITNAVDTSINGSRISAMTLNNMFLVPNICNILAQYTTTATVRSINIRQRLVYCNPVNVITNIQCGNLFLRTSSIGYNSNIPTIYLALMFPPSTFAINLAETRLDQNPGATYADRIYIIYIADNAVPNEALLFAKRTVANRGTSPGMYVGQLPTNPTSSDVQVLVDVLAAHLTNFGF